MLGLMARQQQNFLERIVPCNFVDQRIEKRPASNIQRRLPRCCDSVPRRRIGSRAKSPDQDDRLPQHRVSSTKLQCMCPKATSKLNIGRNTSPSVRRTTIGYLALWHSPPVPAFATRQKSGARPDRRLASPRLLPSQSYASARNPARG
jgi:hypothetical protein